MFYIKFSDKSSKHCGDIYPWAIIVNYLVAVERNSEDCDSDWDSFYGDVSVWINIVPQTKRTTKNK